MKNQNRLQALILVPVLLAAVLFMAWYIPSTIAAHSALDSLKNDLDTVQGKERKQKYEYSQAMEELPELRESIDTLVPLVESAKTESDELKRQKKDLNKEKKQLEKLLEERTGSESAEIGEAGK